MGKRAGEGRKSGGAGQKTGKRTSTGSVGMKCQVGRTIHASRRAAEQASPSGRAERCGRCRQWHAAEDRSSRR